MATLNEAYSQLTKMGMTPEQLEKLKSGYASSWKSPEYLKKEISAFKTNPSGYGAVAAPSQDEVGGFTVSQKKALQDAKIKLGDAAARDAARRMLEYNRSIWRVAPTLSTTGKTGEKKPEYGVGTIETPAQAATGTLVPEITAAGTDSGFTDNTVDKLGDEAETISKKTEAQVAAQSAENATMAAAYDKLDDESKARYKEFDDAFKKQNEDLQGKYSELQTFLKTAYEQSSKALGQRRAGQMSDVAGKLSGAGVSSSMLANALSEIRNNPALQQEEANITKQYVDGLSSQVTTFNSALSALNQNRSSLSDKELAFAKDLVAQRKAALEKITAIKKEGIDAIFKPAIETQAEVRKAATDEEMKTKKSVYSQREYEGAPENVRMDRLQDSLFQYGSDYAGFDRSKLSAEDLKKAAQMSSFAEAKQYLANRIAQIVAAEKDADRSAASGGTSGSKWTTPAGSTTGSWVTVAQPTPGKNAAKQNFQLQWKDAKGNNVYKRPDGTLFTLNPDWKTVTEGGVVVTPKNILKTPEVSKWFPTPSAGGVDATKKQFVDWINSGNYKVWPVKTSGTEAYSWITKTANLPNLIDLLNWDKTFIENLSKLSQAYGVSQADGAKKQAKFLSDVLLKSDIWKWLEIITDNQQDAVKQAADWVNKQIRLRASNVK